MKYKKLILLVIVLGLGMVAKPAYIYGQEYDYHREESPAVSWNGVTLFDARMLAAGGISLMSSPAFASVINPAMIPDGNKTILGASVEFTMHQAFQYWGINQGVYADANPQSGTGFFPGGITLSLPLKSFRLAAGWYIRNLLELPDFNYNGQSWRYSVKSKGKESGVFAATAFKLGKIDFGVKFDYIFGKREVEIDDDWKSYPAEIIQSENHRLSYMMISAGMVLNISPVWEIGGGVVYPFEGTAKRTIDRIFESDIERIEILGLESTDSLFRPTRFYLGATFSPGNKSLKEGTRKFIFAVEAVYSIWSGYEYEFYSELLPRQMKNTTVLSLGMEYNFDGYSARLGYRLDPQPVKTPETTLHAVTGGFGMHLGHVSIDFGAALYFSDYQDFGQKHLLVVCTAYFPLGGK